MHVGCIELVQAQRHAVLYTSIVQDQSCNATSTGSQNRQAHVKLPCPAKTTQNPLHSLRPLIKPTFVWAASTAMLTKKRENAIQAGLKVSQAYSCLIQQMQIAQQNAQGAFFYRKPALLRSRLCAAGLGSPAPEAASPATSGAEPAADP